MPRPMPQRGRALTFARDHGGLDGNVRRPGDGAASAETRFLVVAMRVGPRKWLSQRRGAASLRDVVVIPFRLLAVPLENPGRHMPSSVSSYSKPQQVS